MNILTLDVETTTWNKGNPFDRRNKLVLTGVKKLNDRPVCFDKSFHFSILQDWVNSADVLVGFNIKFDIHWLMNIGVTLDNVKQIWDCQIAEFLLESQLNKYPSLNEAMDKYGLPRKLDVVKSEYWDKGLNTTDVPAQILLDYLEGDLVGTEEVFKRQARQFGVIL